MEVVLTGSRVALPGLVEISIGPPTGNVVLLTKANTMIIVEGSRLPPGDVLDTSQLTHVRYQPLKSLG